uniref:Reverse transcriptase domain-containing protein n=1 Tax=Podarcis muralis TaxID=64176 RepID=A0A670IED3_PODMU
MPITSLMTNPLMPVPIIFNNTAQPEKRKRNKIEQFLKRKNLDIICLQETHVAKRHRKILINKRLGNEFDSSDKEKKRGVVLYVRNKIEANQIFKDEEGRMVAVRLNWQGENIVVIGVYAPNGNKTDFFKILEEKILEYMDQKIVLMGDMNGVVSLEADRLREGASKEGKLPKSFFSMVKNCNLVDIWRLRHPLDKQYTFHSDPHQSMSRIDQVWISSELCPRVKQIEIRPKVISDHNPIELELESYERRTFRWRLREYLLDDQSIVKTAQKKLTDYFADNCDKGTKISVVWDASKAVIRGYFIQQNAIKNKNREKGKKEILEQIMDNEQKLIQKPNCQKIKENIKILQAQFATIINREVEWNIKKLRQKNFEFSNKSGKWLAWQIKKRKEQGTINKITAEGEEITDPRRIRKEFLDYYRSLYKNKERNNLRKIERFLKDKEVQKIPIDKKRRLNTPIEKEEIEDVIKELKRGKAPGPDGFTVGYYKEMKSILVSPLKETMNNILKKGEIPETWKEALIMFIPKQDADLTQVKNYRPISLLNIDYKIFAGILARRLKSLLLEIIHKDQAGFLPGRHMRDNTRNIINMLEYLSVKIDKQVVMMFVDAEKALDNVVWDFMLKILEHMEVGKDFFNGVKAIYTEQKAKLMVNNIATEEIKIQKGTRQGCPLSPLLFIMVLEVLLNSIRQNKKIKGVTFGQNVYKIKAFADDVVIMTEDPMTTLDEVLKEIDQFGELAGFKLNKGKTKLIVKNVDQRETEIIQQRSQIEVAKKVKYLGIWLTPKNIDLFKNNYESVWKEIRKDLEVWGRLKLSFWGRINTIKMNILPRVLFLFQTIPIIKGSRIFKEWQKVLSRYIWQGKKPRIQFKLLTDIKERGGFALPDLKLYYEASCLCWLKDWVNLENRELLDLEGFNNRFGWHAYLGLEKRKVHRGFANHIFRGPIIEIWERYKNILEPKAPHWFSPLEAMSVKKINMRSNWATYSQLSVKEDGKWKLKPYEQVKEHVYDWLHYFQVNEMFRKDIKEKGYADKDSKFQMEIINNDVKIISKMYRMLLDWNLGDEEVKSVMTRWAIDVGHNIQFEDWEKLWKEGLNFTACLTVKENVMKMFYRWYITPVKLSKMYKTSSKCWKCKDKEGSFYHLWWECRKVKEFWERIYAELKKILKYAFTKKPEIFLLGILGKDIEKKDSKFVYYAVTAARIILAQKWKKQEVPTTEEWRSKLLDYAELDRLTGKIRYKRDQEFLKDWGKYVEYLECISEGKTTLKGFKEAL